MNDSVAVAENILGEFGPPGSAKKEERTLKHK